MAAFAGCSRVALAWVAVSLLVAPGNCGSGPHEEFAKDLAPFTNAHLTNWHKTADKNKNGKVSLKEMVAHAEGIHKTMPEKDVAELLKEVDTNSDKQVTLEEVLHSMRPDNYDELSKDPNVPEYKLVDEEKAFTTETFNLADADSNGVLEGQEIAAYFHPPAEDRILAKHAVDKMRQMDRDKDSKLTLIEFVTNGEDPSEFGDIDFEKTRGAIDFRHLDKDDSGALTMHELKEYVSGFHVTHQALKKLFETADADKDNAVTHEELQRAQDSIINSPAHYYINDLIERGEL